MTDTEEKRMQNYIRMKAQHACFWLNYELTFNKLSEVEHGKMADEYVEDIQKKALDKYMNGDFSE